MILAILTEVVEHVATAVKESLKEEGAATATDVIKRAFKSLRGQSEKATPVPQIQLQQIHKSILDKAHQLQVPPAKAQIIADAIIGELVLIPA